MKYLFTVPAALCLLLAAGCSNDHESSNEARESIRDNRYCEITPLYLGPEGITSNTWNTADLNDCPAEDWEALDFAAIKQELGAVVVRENGPRYYVMDAAELAGREQTPRRFFGNLEFRLVANVQYDFVPPPPGTYFFEASVLRDTRFLFYAGRPVYELLAPLGKRYVMQSYAQIADPTLTLADLDSIGTRISVPEGWEYRVRVLEEDLLVEDFQGFASALRDQLENTYQRAETLEYLPVGRVAVELYNGDTMQSWTALMSEQEAAELQVGLPWQRNDQVGNADKSVYARSPDAEVDGRFSQMTLAGMTFSYSGQVLAAAELHPSGLITTGESSKYHELTYRSGRTIAYITNPDGEHFVLVSKAPDALPEPAMLPTGWSHGEAVLIDDWRVVFEGSVVSVETLGASSLYQGPVSLPAS